MEKYFCNAKIWLLLSAYYFCNMKFLSAFFHKLEATQIVVSTVLDFYIVVKNRMPRCAAFVELFKIFFK